MKRLVYFDFDDTLFLTPHALEGIEQWVNKTGSNFPDDDFWRSKKSLDTEIYDIKPVDWIINEYEKHLSNEDYLIMATGRIEDLKDDVMNILDDFELKFNEYHFKPANKDTYNFKIKLFEKLLDKYNPSEFYMYDDRFDHIERFKGWSLSKPNIKITIIDSVRKTIFCNHNDDNTFLTFDEFKLFNK